jgi:hypothetical protein
MRYSSKHFPQRSCSEGILFKAMKSARAPGLGGAWSPKAGEGYEDPELVSFSRHQKDIGTIAQLVEKAHESGASSCGREY